MPRLFLLFSHQLTPDQMADAQRTLATSDWVALPAALQARWSEIPPDADTIADHLQPIFDWLQAAASPGDFVLIQGDFGAVYLAVTFAVARELIPIYATTARQVVETRLPDGQIQTQRIFAHVRYRRYVPYAV